MLILDEIKKIFLPKNIWKPFTNRPIQQNYIFPSEDNINLYEVIETVVDDLNVGGNLSVTDGTNTVTDTTEIHLMGATVSGSSGSATITIGGGAGEANTASNVGTAGVGIYKTKAGVDLKFKKLNAGSNKVTITDDTGNDEIDIDVVPANFTSIPQSAVTNLTTDLAAKQPLDATLTGLSSLSSTQGFLYQTGTPDSFSIQSVVATTLGGTGTSMTPSLGDMLVATGGGPYTFTPLAANSTGTKKFLSQTSSVASWSTLSVNDLSELSSAAQGSIAYKGASAWTVLTPGTAGQVLTTNGASADPSWANASGGATTLDGLTDVTVTSPATGAVLYYNGTQWVNLAAGTTGQYLQGGTTPSWATPSGSGSTLVSVVNTISELETTPATTSLICVVTDINRGGIFYRVTGGGAYPGGTDDNVFVFSHPAGGTARWRRLITDFVRPEWWGAVGDGTTNDALAFQAMFASRDTAYPTGIAASDFTVVDTSGSGAQYLGFNNYLIQLSANKQYLLDPAHASTGIGRDNILIGKAAYGDYAGSENSQVREVTIEGNGAKVILANGNNDSAFRIRDGQGITIRNIKFYGNNQATFNSSFHHSLIHISPETGTPGVSGFGNAAGEILIENCSFRHFSNNAIRIHGLEMDSNTFYRGVVIRDCYFSNEDSGVTTGLFDATSTLQAAVFADGPIDTVNSVGSEYCKIENCSFYLVPRAFVSAATSKAANWTFTNNTVSRSTATQTTAGIFTFNDDATGGNFGKMLFANNVINHNETSQSVIYLKRVSSGYATDYNRMLVLDHNQILANSDSRVSGSRLIYAEKIYCSFVGNNFQIRGTSPDTPLEPVVYLLDCPSSRFVANTFINGKYPLTAENCSNLWYDSSNNAFAQTTSSLPNLIGTSTRLALTTASGGTGLTTLGTAGQVLRVNAGANGLEYGTISGTGDFSSNTSTSVDSELVLFSGTGGKTGKRATGSGIAKLTSGVLSTVTAPSGALVGDTDFQTLTNKTISGGSNTISNIDASNISSGTVAAARLGSGTANNTTYLRGDNTWATVSGGGGSLTVKEEGSTVGTSGGITTIDFVGDNVTATGSTSTATVTVKGTDIVHLTSGTGNWTVPTGAKYIEVALIGAGGGGGNGAVGATNAYGGLGGFSGNIVFFKSACIGTYAPGSTIPYSVGVGGTGGGGGASAPTNGTGTDTTFGLYIATGGVKGINGTSTSASNSTASLNAPATTTTNLFSTFLVLRNNLGGGNTTGGTNNLSLATLGSGGGMAGGSIVSSAVVGTNTGYAVTGGSLVGIVDPTILGHPASAGSAGVTTDWPIICGLQTASGGRGGAANIGSAGGNGGAGVNGSGGGGGGGSTTTAGTGGNGGNGRISILIHY